MRNLCKAFGIPQNLSLDDYWDSVVGRIGRYVPLEVHTHWAAPSDFFNFGLASVTKRR